MNWDTFERASGFEELIFELTEKSIELVLASSLPEKNFSAFAFTCFSFGGNISLSFGVDPGYEDSERRIRLCPADWEHEVMQDSIKEVGELWENYYQINERYAEAVYAISDMGELGEFCGGFLRSLRKVMVRLEKTGTLQKLSHKPVWTLVTELDADTEEEELLLEQERKLNN